MLRNATVMQFNTRPVFTWRLWFLAAFAMMAFQPALAGAAEAEPPTARQDGTSGAENPVAPDRIATQTDKLRALLAVDMNGVSGAITRDELRTLTGAFGPPTEDRDILASWLMRGGLVATANSQGLSGIYNPLADAWLVLGWRNIGGSPRLVWAALLEGHALRSAGQPDWIEAKGPLGEELLRVKRQSFASLSAVPDGLGSDGLVELAERFRGSEGLAVLERARAMTGALGEWSRNNPKMLAKVQSEMGKCKCAALRSLAGKTRETLSPTALLTASDGDLLVLQSPLTPAQAVLVQVAGSKPDFELLDLSMDHAGSLGQ